MTQSFGTFAAPQLGTAYDKFLTERFTRTDEFTINYEFTIEDPSTFTDKITVQLPMAKVDGLLYEYACHEGNYGLLNTLRGARQEEQDAVDLQLAQVNSQFQSLLTALPDHPMGQRIGPAILSVVCFRTS